MLTVGENIALGESRSHYNAVAPSGTVTCTAFGTNADGTPGGEHLQQLRDQDLLTRELRAARRSPRRAALP